MGFSAEAAKLVNQSHEMFFPREMADVAQPYEHFPSFWWNFIILETPSAMMDPIRESLCKEIAKNWTESVRASNCKGDLSPFKELLTDWAKDLPLRAEFLSEQHLKTAVERSRAQASFPGSSQLLWLLRVDPFQSYLDFKRIAEQNTSSIERIFSPKEISPGTFRWVIPVQFNFAPSQVDKTKAWKTQLIKVCGPLGCGSVALLGPHISVLENQTRVQDDLMWVNFVGILTMIALIGFLVVVRRLRLLLIVLPLTFSIGIGLLITIGVYGSVHALTLAFGTGLVGLAVDYGLHSAFWRKAWTANLFGMLTSVAVFATAFISNIPLLRQMMFFGAAGLIVAFLMLYLLFRWNEQLFVVPAFKIKHKLSKLKFGVVIVCCLGIVYGILFVKPNFDLRLFNYQSEKTRALQSWLYEAFANRRPVIEVMPSSEELLQKQFERSDFAKEHQIDYESVTRYIPRIQEQQKNIPSWESSFCPQRKWKLSPELEEFAKPFFETQNCQTSYLVQNLTGEYVPRYVQHLYHDSKWAFLWFPKTAEEIQAIKHQFPKSVAIEEVASIFAKSLSRDIFYIVLLSIGGVFALLAVEFKNWRMVLMASMPFFAGAGMVFWFFALMGWPMSFMGLIGLTMVCGFSVDYGIFVTDGFKNKRLKNADGLWSALAMCAICTVGGFLPMIFGQHPVLQHLSFSLLIGSLGTYIGTIWGVLGLARYVFKMDVDDAD